MGCAIGVCMWGIMQLPAESPRTWTSLDGREVTATLVRQESGVALLKLDNGRISRIPFDILSAADLRYLKSRKALEGFGPGITGRTVRIRSTHASSWCLAEVEVYSGHDNLAPQGEASQSRTLYKAEADRAIDENPDGIYANRSVSYIGADKKSWWQVTLKESTPIHKIIVWNRTDRLTDKMAGHVVEILNDADEVVWSHKLEEAPSPSVALRVGGGTTTGPGAATKSSGEGSSPDRQNWKLADGRSLQGRVVARRGPLVKVLLDSGRAVPLALRAFADEDRERALTALRKQAGETQPPRPIDYEAAGDIGDAKTIHTLILKLWLPDEHRPVDGLLAVLPELNADATGIIPNNEWRELAAANNVGLLACTLKTNRIKQREPPWYDQAHLDSGRIFLNALQQLVLRSGHDELTRVPLAFHGFREGGTFAINFACWQPRRVRAVVAVKPKKIDGKLSALEGVNVSMLIVMSRDQPEEEQNSIAVGFQTLRKTGVAAALAHDPQGNVEHTALEFTRTWLAASQFGRLPGLVPMAGDLKTGKTIRLGERMMRFPGAAWLPDAATAEAWSAFHSPP